MNSRYNALLIAREDIDIAKEYISLNHQDNYEEILPIFKQIDSTKLDTAKLYLVDAVKKASVIAERHSNSKYLDDAYLLIGEARILKGEYENAIETFKYLNTISESETHKTEALSQMMRAYLELKDFQNADQLITLLKSRPMNKSSRTVHLQNLAYYNQLKGEITVAAVLLEEAVKNMKKGGEKARMYYVLGQMYDRLGQVTLARKNYRLVLKNKPDYDLAFNAEMGLLMTESLARNTGLLFEKMLDDRKNQDVKYKIYYKMAETELRKNKPEEAILLFQKAVIEANNKNDFSKAFSYKAKADVYLDKFLDYEKAAIYYDSTVITIPREYLKNSDIGDRAMYLNEFIKYQKVYNLEDSLQRLAALSPEVMDYTLEKIITEKRDKEKREVEAKALKPANQTNNAPAVSPQKRWRLYDPQQVAKEKNEFVMKWGNRELEDDWRRSQKSRTTFVFNEAEKKMVEQAIVPTTDSTALTTASSIGSQINMEEQEKKIIAEEVNELKKRIPTGWVQMRASKRKQEEAVYRIAKIYKLKFKDDVKAAETFNRFLKDYPDSYYTPEVLYFLAMDEPDPVHNAYSERLVKDFPNTSYGRLIRKGNIVFTKDQEDEANRYYREAFLMYDQGRYKEAVDFLENGLNQFVGSQIEDKMALLRIYSIAKVGQKDQYMISLNDFIKSYPTSGLIAKVKELLEYLEKNG